MIQKKEIEFAKELDDVLVLVIELIKDIKAKKSAAQIGTENIPLLMTAIGNIDQLPEEAKNKPVVLSTIGYRAGELAASFVE
jgi:hypothetical protein